jgi:hypothetical protein
MFTNKIYCFGDGYAAGHIWPEWPQILQALLPEYEVIVESGIGAGPEWLVTKFVQSLDKLPNATVIFQWPQPDRFDKLIQDQHWQTIADCDPVYYFNLHCHNNQTWWLSSASDSAEIVQYHRDFVQLQQHQLRLANYQILVKNTLENLNCSYFFFSTAEQEIYSQQNKFLTVKQKEIQPSPLVHFDYCVEKILPSLNIDIKCHDKLQSLIENQTWIPYDPNREEIWQKIKDQFKTLTDK